MAKVNLLYSETSKAKKAIASAPQIQKVPIFTLSLSIIVLLIGISLRLVNMFQERGLNKVISRYQQAENLAGKFKELKKEQEKLNQEINFVDGYLKREILWSTKLNQLRSLIPKEIWLTQLSFERKEGEELNANSLFLKGGLVPQNKSSPIGTLSKLINQIKEDKEFFIDFDNPILTDLRTEIRKNVEIMAFTIEMPFRKK